MSKMLVALAAMGGLFTGLASAADEPPVATTQATAPVVPSSRALEAIIAVHRAELAANPNDAVAHNRLGVCYQYKGQFKQARKEYEKAIDLARDYAEAWNNLGTLEHAQRKYKKAVSRYRKALELKPAHAPFYRNLGAAWLAADNLAMAASAYAEAVRLDPRALDSGNGFQVAGVDPSRLYFAYAKAFAAKGDLESAFLWLGRAREAGFRDFYRCSSDPDFAELVKDPRYADLRR